MYIKGSSHRSHGEQLQGYFCVLLADYASEGELVQMPEHAFMYLDGAILSNLLGALYKSDSTTVVMPILPL